VSKFTYSGPPPRSRSTTDAAGSGATRDPGGRTAVREDLPAGKYTFSRGQRHEFGYRGVEVDLRPGET
jgi:hypothetical protein